MLLLHIQPSFPYSGLLRYASHSEGALFVGHVGYITSSHRVTDWVLPRRQLFLATAMSVFAVFAGGAVALGADPDSTAATQIDSALKRYISLVIAQNHDELAALFTVEGEIVNPGSEPIRGRAAISKFFASFTGYEILVYDIKPSEPTIHGRTATQSGSFYQRVRRPDSKILEASGQFQADWECNKTGQWQIQRMSTKPRL